MAQLNLHNNKSNLLKPLPPTLSVVISKEKVAYQNWLKLHRNFPRTERLSLGQKICQLFLEVIELSFVTTYSSSDRKIIILSKTISRLDILKLFLQIAWENKLIATEKYIDLSEKLQEIGRMLGGWKKSLLSKTPIKFKMGEKQ